MTIYAVGSIADDYVLFYDGAFPLPFMMGRGFNFSIVADRMIVHRGGTATAIAYNLSLMGISAGVVSAVGADGDHYFEWFSGKGIATDGLAKIEDTLTARAFIATDKLENQISLFFPGALSQVGERVYRGFDWAKASMVVISAGAPRGHRLAVDICLRRSVAYIYNPGQTLSELSREDLVRGVANSSALLLNDFELAQATEKTGLTERELAKLVPLMVTTLGEGGSVLRRGSEEVMIPAVNSTRCVDPTGAGDAYCAGLIKGLSEGRPLRAIGQISTLAAAYAIELEGVVEHRYTWAEFSDRYKSEFGDAP